MCLREDKKCGGNKLCVGDKICVGDRIRNMWEIR